MSDKNLGLGVMIQMLSGNESTVNAIKSSIGKTIKVVRLDKEGDSLKFEFDDGTKLAVWDGGQSCCEHRYMSTDDDLTKFAGEKLVGFEIRNTAGHTGEYGDEHDIQFLDVLTDKGRFTMANHNEHNGYYGGFALVAATN